MSASCYNCGKTASLALNSLTPDSVARSFGSGFYIDFNQPHLGGRPLSPRRLHRLLSGRPPWSAETLFAYYRVRVIYCIFAFRLVFRLFALVSHDFPSNPLWSAFFYLFFCSCSRLFPVVEAPFSQLVKRPVACSHFFFSFSPGPRNPLSSFCVHAPSFYPSLCTGRVIFSVRLMLCVAASICALFSWVCDYWRSSGFVGKMK